MNSGVLKFSAGGAILIVNEGSENSLRFNGGAPVQNDGTLVVSANDPTLFLGGLGYDQTGALCADPTDAITHYAGGLPVTAKGALAIGSGYLPSVLVAGIPIGSDGRVCSDLLT